MVVTYSSQVKKRQDKSNICFVHTCYPRRNLCQICDYFCWAWTISKTSCTLMTTKKANLRNFFCFFFKYKISRSVNNKAMVHQNTIFKNYFSIYWGFFFLEKWEFIGYSMHLYWRLKSLHFPWTAGCKLPRLYCSDELYLVAMKKKRPICVKENSWPHFCLDVLFFFNQISISR